VSRFHLLFLTGVLALTGLGLFAYKALVLHFPLVPDAATTLWSVEAQVSFAARNKPVKLSLYIPESAGRYLVMDESFISRGFGLSTGEKGGNRQAVWSVRKASGTQTLYYRALIRRVEKTVSNGKAETPIAVDPGYEGANVAAADALINDLRAKSADIESFTSGVLRALNRPGSDENVSHLLGKKANELRKMEVAVALLGRAQIPARVVRGIRLQDQSQSALLVPWVEVFDEGRWHAHDPLTGARGIPDTYLSWWTGLEPLIQGKGAEEVRTVVSVESQQEEALDAAVIGGATTDPLLHSFSLFNLPVRTQIVYRILLLVPIGAALVVFLRNVIGIKTFGTFMPVLVALAFRETKLLEGILLFTLLVAVGLMARFYLERLKLLLVPRLGSVLIIVVISMAALSLITHKMGLGHGLSVALFPMIILTMTIERMSIVWEELGASAAIRQGIGTLVVASLTYAVFTQKWLEHLLFVFPELLLVLLAGTLLMGRYTGYRLLELKRFRSILGQEG